MEYKKSEFISPRIKFILWSILSIVLFFHALGIIKFLPEQNILDFFGLNPRALIILILIILSLPFLAALLAILDLIHFILSSRKISQGRLAGKKRPIFNAILKIAEVIINYFGSIATPLVYALVLTVPLYLLLKKFYIIQCSECGLQWIFLFVASEAAINACFNFLRRPVQK